MDAPQLLKNTGLIETALLPQNPLPSSLIWALGYRALTIAHYFLGWGVDIFDLARSRQASSLGVLLTESGPRPRAFNQGGLFNGLPVSNVDQFNFIN